MFRIQRRKVIDNLSSRGPGVRSIHGTHSELITDYGGAPATVRFGDLISVHGFRVFLNMSHARGRAPPSRTRHLRALANNARSHARLQRAI